MEFVFFFVIFVGLSFLGLWDLYYQSVHEKSTLGVGASLLILAVSVLMCRRSWKDSLTLA